MNTEKNSTSAHSALNYPPTMEELERKFDVEKLKATKLKVFKLVSFYYGDNSHTPK